MNKRPRYKITIIIIIFDNPFKGGRFCWIEWLAQALGSFLPWQPSWLWIVWLKEAALYKHIKQTVLDVHNNTKQK